MRKLSDIVMEFVDHLGVREIFYPHGGESTPLVDSLARDKKLNQIVCLSERDAIIAANACGRRSGFIGVALVTTDMAGIDAVVGDAALWAASAPLLVISGRSVRPDPTGGRAEDVAALASRVAKYAVTVSEPEKIIYHLERAIHTARLDQPGPAWVDIPPDVQGAMVEETHLPHFVPDSPPHESGMGRASGAVGGRPEAG